MWLIPTKKEVKKEFKKIKDSLKVRDETSKSLYDEINKSYNDCINSIKELKEISETNSLKIATLEGAYLVLSQKSQVSVLGKSQAVPSSPKQSKDTFETKLIQRIRQNKKSLVMAEIVKLMPFMSVIDMFEVIVIQKRLCSKASFYRYIDSLRSQSLINQENKVRLN